MKSFYTIKHQTNIFTHSVFSLYPSIIPFERENEKEGWQLIEYLLPLDHSLLNSNSEEFFNSGRFFLLLVRFCFPPAPVSFPSTNFLGSIGTHETVSANEEPQF